MSLLATGVVAALAYPLLVAVTRPLAVLSTTALVFALASLLAVVWLLLDLAWTHATRR